MAQQRQPPPPELIGDAVGEILLAPPRTSSAHLVRASLVCKLWRRVVSDPDFARRYREFHRTPPLLGFFNNSNTGCQFYPTMAACPFPQPASDCSRRLETLDYRRLWALVCRHGRVLLRHKYTKSLLVCDPMTGDREELPEPQIPKAFYHGMVLCAATGCDHCDCSRLGGPFLVVMVGITSGSAHGCEYSSMARAWGTVASVVNLDRRHCYFASNRGGLVGRQTYFTLRSVAIDYDTNGIKRSNGINLLKYDVDKNLLSIDIDLQLDMCGGDVVVMPTHDGSLELATVKGSRLYLWSRKKVNSMGVARWVQCRVIELEKLLRIGLSYNQADVVGFAEGVGVMFVRVDYTSTFMIELNSGQVRKVDKFGRLFPVSVLPFMSFYTPGSAGNVMPLSVEKIKHTEKCIVVPG